MLVKFLIIGDLHGRIPVIHDSNFDAIICPGDICGDDIRPYIKKQIELRTKRNKDVDFREVCPLWKEKYLSLKSLKKGRRILKFLNKFNKPVFVVPGNWDQTPYLDGGLSRDIKTKQNNWEKIKKGLKNIKDIEYKKTKFLGINLVGHGSTSAPEAIEKLDRNKFDNQDEFKFHNKRYKFQSKIFKKLTKYFENLDQSPTILLTHNVPHKTKLDKVNAPRTYAHNKHYGSIIARKLIDKFQPLLCIGGHIHEGYGQTRLKKTLCINSGFGGDVNTILTIDTKKKKIVEIKFLGENLDN